MGHHIRGDVTLTIAGQEYTVTPNFEVLAAIEAATGLGLIETMTAVGALRVNTIAKVIAAALGASGYKVPTSEIGEEIMSSIGDKKQPLFVAAIEILNAAFPKTATGKKPVKAKGSPTEL